MATVSDMLRTKGHDIWSVSPDDSVYDALKLMAEKNIGAVLVKDAGDLVGILSERDYARKVVLQGKTATDTPAREIMTESVICVPPEETAEECMALMTEKKVRHLPVLEDEQLIGVISIGDVVKAIIPEQEFIIEQLEHYVRGTPYVGPAPCDSD
ncbi:MAG: CBS domain-containing protein [Anaerolineae bacterium]|jgi:CBS domain-containing protein